MLEQDRWPLPSQFPVVDQYSSTDWDSRADVTDGFEEGTHFLLIQTVYQKSGMVQKRYS